MRISDSVPVDCVSPQGYRHCFCWTVIIYLLCSDRCLLICCRYELHHGVRISDSALVDAAELSNRYIADRFLPDKAIDIIDESAAKLKMEITSKPLALDEIDRKVPKPWPHLPTSTPKGCKPVFEAGSRGAHCCMRSGHTSVKNQKKTAAAAQVEVPMSLGL